MTGLTIEEHFEASGYVLRAVDGRAGATITADALGEAVARARRRALAILEEAA